MKCPNCKGRLFLHQTDLYLYCARCKWTNNKKVQYKETDFITFQK